MILDYVNKTFNNREIALISYLLIFIIWALTQKKIRKSFMPVVKAIMAWKILASIFALVIYVALVVYGLFKMIIRNSSYCKFGLTGRGFARERILA